MGHFPLSSHFLATLCDLLGYALYTVSFCTLFKVDLATFGVLLAIWLQFLNRFDDTDNNSNNTANNNTPNNNKIIKVNVQNMFVSNFKLRFVQTL